MANPIEVDEAAAADWREGGSPVVAAAMWWARNARRGRGAVPRMLSRLLSKNVRQTVRTKHGARLAMAPRALDVYAAIRRKGGAWDSHVFEACRRLLAPGEVFYDIGANVGYMTIEMAVAFGGKVRCVAFEPQPDLARCIAVSAHLNGVQDSVQVFDAMVGQHTGRSALAMTSHSIHASPLVNEAGGKRVERPMISLDELVAEGAVPPPDVIKIDIEGGELDAFKGGQTVIREHQPDIVFEAARNPEAVRKNLFALLGELADYEFFDVEGDGSLCPLDNDSHEHPRYGTLDERDWQKHPTLDVLARSVRRHKSR
jgi:FkbM family methyltransferase